MLSRWVVLFGLGLVSCGHPSSQTQDSTTIGKADGQFQSECPLAHKRTIATTDLVLNVVSGRATATIGLDIPGCSGVELVIEDLTIDAVTDASGNPLEWQLAAFSNAAGNFDTLIIPAALDTVVVDYAFESDFADSTARPDVYSTLSWPHKCGRIMPCHTDPNDGLKLTVEVEGLQDGEVAITTPALSNEAASYMAAAAIGPYQEELIGTSASGIVVHAWWLPILGEERQDEILAAMAPVVPAIDWLETNLGPYGFGKNIGAVEVDWGPGTELGGMEHHPFWHVDDGTMTDIETQIHELIHGWYGNGIRIGCWEDFILSEGVTSYLTARVMGQVIGPEAEAELWSVYAEDRSDWENTEAWRDGECTLFTVEGTEIWSLAPYRRGAFFFKKIADEIGAEKLDAAFATFYQENQGRSARFADLLDHIEAQTGFDAPTLAHNTLL